MIPFQPGPGDRCDNDDLEGKYDVQDIVEKSVMVEDGGGGGCSTLMSEALVYRRDADDGTIVVADSGDESDGESGTASCT